MPTDIMYGMETPITMGSISPGGFGVWDLMGGATGNGAGAPGVSVGGAVAGERMTEISGGPQLPRPEVAPQLPDAPSPPPPPEEEGVNWAMVAGALLATTAAGVAAVALVSGVLYMRRK